MAVRKNKIRCRNPTFSYIVRLHLFHRQLHLFRITTSSYPLSLSINSDAKGFLARQLFISHASRDRRSYEKH